MGITRPPVLFVTHGAPTLALCDGPAHRFLKGLAATIVRPRAIVVLSAHWGSDRPRVGTAAALATIHDFGPFDPRLFDIHYPARSAPDIAAKALRLLTEAGFAPTPDPARGLDHGAWVPLMLAYPDAAIPVVPVSIQPDGDAAHHYRLGQALRPLRDEGVLILASGSITHNLRELVPDPNHDQAPPWVAEFADWVASRCTERRDGELLAWSQAPSGQANHPTAEHLMPLFVALGAADPDEPARRVHHSITYGVLAMDNYQFGGAA